MYSQLFQYIQKHTALPLTIAEEEVITQCFVAKKIRKHQFFLQEGEICKQYAFLVKGAMRQYTVDDKGTERIVNLFLEDWWVGDRESNIKNKPSNYYIDAWENAELLLVSREDMLNKLAPIPAIAEVLREMDNRHAIALQNRVSSAISLSAEQRYSELVKNYPEFLQRFPQHTIASYLGITKETLSRIRKKASKN